MEYQTPVEHINKVCDYLKTKGNILKRSGPYVRELDEETDEDETTYNTEFDPEKVAAGGSRVASRAAVRDCESVTELLGGGLHSGWAGPPVSSVGDHSPRDLCVFVGIRGGGARPGAPENPLMPIDPKPRPRLADSPPESLSSRSPASVGQATGSGGPTRSRSVCP